MIPFNKIPRGLRVPLFFGELAIDGDVLGGSPQPPQPGISCVGATNSVLMHRAILIDQNESTVIPEGENFIMNGAVAEQPPEYLGINPVSPPPFPPPIGYKWVESIQIKNNSNQDVRFEHRILPDNQNLIQVVLSENPTVISFDENRNGVCLSGETGSIISCVGATQTMVFSPSPHFNGEINWTIEFDGVAYDLGKVWAGDIVNNMPSHIKDKVWMDWDGVWILENRDSAPHRFKLTPSPKPEFDPIQGWSGNESLVINADGSFTFCLAGVEPVYPPYAVVKTSALWGSSFPAKITVNGTEYSGDLFGNLADILAHQYNIYTGFERIYGDFEGDPDLVRVVFAGDVFAENASISVEFLSEIAINIDDSFSYPENDTLQVNGKSASFNIGKLVCITKVAQYGSINNSNFLLEYGQPFNFRVGDKINTNVLTNRIAGAGIEDPASFCASAASPEGCVQSNLLSNLSEQWNPELRTINVKVSWSGLSRVVMPLNASDDKGIGDPFATAKFVVQPNDKTPINDMYFLGYTIPTCDDMPS